MSAPGRATWRIAIVAFDDMEALDFAGPFEVFTTAARVAARRTPDAAALLSVCTVAPQSGVVRARAGLRCLSDHSYADAPEVDAVLVPGGVIDGLLTTATRDWLRAQAARGVQLLSVCTGAFVLAHAGLLDGCRVTTHWEDLADLQQRYPDLHVVSGPRWIEQDDGRLTTSAGIAAGIDMSLHTVARWFGQDLAQATARQMDYPWDPQG